MSDFVLRHSFVIRHSCLVILLALSVTPLFAQKRPITLVPLNAIFDERYAVYWKVSEGAAAQAGGADT